MRVADYLMSRLADLGVREVFFLPGGGAMYLDDGLACEKRLTPVPCHHEQACGIAAEANGRTSPAGFGVALVTTGPGATNVLTPVAGAWIESLPLLVISGQVKRADALRGRPLRQSGVQEVDVVAMARPVTKYAITVAEPNNIRRCFEEAIWHMRSGRPGPVWLDIPLDVQAAQVDPAQLPAFVPPPTIAGDPLPAAVERLNGLLAKARRPLLLAGHGVRIAGAADAFRQLAESLGIPCAFTWNAADLLPWEHPLYVGRPGVVAARAPNFAVQNCDCLISIGCRLDNIITAYNPKGFAREAAKIVVDVDPNELARHEMPLDLAVAADARSFIEAWRAAPPAAGDWQDWRSRCQDWKRRYPALDGRSFDGDPAISHYGFIDVLSDVLPENRLAVTGSSGLAVEVFYTVFRNKPGQRMFLTSGLGAMGYGLPAAIGACLGAGRAPTVCIESDGSLMLNLQELATLKALDLPVVIVIMNNNGYASIRNTQRNYFEGRYLGTGPEAGVHIPDFVALAEAIGLPARRIDRVEDLPSGLAQALARPGPSLCEVRLRSNESLAPKVAAIPQPDGSMLSMPLEDMSPLLPLDTLQREMLVPLAPASRQAPRNAA
jgi:acetolactate synthase I/II/III large subunit